MQRQSSPIPIPPPPPRSSASFPLWPFFIIGTLMVLLVIAAGTAIFIWMWAEFREMEVQSAEAQEEFLAKVEKLRAEGHPVSAEDLFGWYPLIDGPNAADAIYAAIEALGDREEAIDNTSVIAPLRNENAYQSPPEELIEDARGVLAQYEDAVAHLRSISEYEQARLDLDFNRVADIEHKHTSLFSVFMRLVHLSADEATARGATDETGEWILRGVRITKFVGEVPMYMSHYRSNMERSEVVQTLRRNLSRRALPREYLDRLQAEFEELDHAAELRRALMGQRAFGIHTVNTLYGDFPGSSDGLDMLAFVEQALADMGDEFPEGYSFESVNRIGSRNSPFHLMPGSAARAPMRVKHYASLDRIAIVILAIERFRDDHGRVPDTLDELVGDYLDAIPLDPFDGQPLRYGLHSSAYFVYSVYSDGIDGGGEMQVMDQSENAVGDQILYINRGLH